MVLASTRENGILHFLHTHGTVFIAGKLGYIPHLLTRYYCNLSCTEHVIFFRFILPFIYLGCDFFAPIHKYTNTQKTVSLLSVGFLPSQPSFVYLFCQNGDFFGPIHGYAYKMTTFLFVYSFFLFVARIEGQIFVSFWSFLGYQQIHRH